MTETGPNPGGEAEVVTYLEMTSPGELRPAAPVPGVTLEAAPPDSPLIRLTVVAVGTPYHWSAPIWSDARWAEWLADPRVRRWLVRRDGAVAGICEAQIHTDNPARAAPAGPGFEVEIMTFGLRPEFVGAGFGGWFLTLVVEAAWAVDQPGLIGPRRVWLHTSTLDHPNALPNYRRRGFRPFRTITRHRPAVTG